MTGFDIYPAIDLRRGRVVRLELGDPARETVFGDNPAAMAGRWRDAGARWLHVVNLDGAFAEAGAANWAALAAIVAAGGVRVQFGGGLRTLDDIAAALDSGAARVVLGTAALASPELLAAAVARFGPERVAAGIDARDGRVRVRGWQTETAVTPAALALSARAAGVTTVITTDIARDGVLTGVNAEATAALAAASGLAVIASGGARDLGDVARLLALAPTAAPGRLAGVILGRALYDGHIDLAAALARAEAG
ncbi:MAG TPA: HisA/HisF-related TIM barrel protein [Promineifilum sp.]|nr:HisA/HisF-related TIM barrel protein [Promineifilum sp.]HQF70173.1 HisA/HisF-related TIM barrel protein [Promineifilum sp.]